MQKRSHVVNGVKRCLKWWIEQRRDKLENQLNETMAINPFILPFLFDFHGLESLEDLTGLIVAGHLLTGHNTGFGKLIDEKILPCVFHTQKLDKEFRKSTKPFQESCFDEIDHICKSKNGRIQLLSLKASRWTIQLASAVKLNHAFDKILSNHSNITKKIVVGVYYGKKETLSDKYDILRGINRGANHDVEDLRNNVVVYAGKEFWQWVNDNEEATQEWVLEGILEALQEDNIGVTSRKLLSEYISSVAENYKDEITRSGIPDWRRFLNKING